MINEYFFHKIIIGGSLESLLYSFVTGSKIIILEPLHPIETEKIEYHRSLRLLGYVKDDIITKSELWNRLTFVLSLNGCVVCPNIVNTHRQTDDKTVIITEGNKRITYGADEIIYFDKVDADNITMIDWFNVRSGNNHQHSTIKDPDNTFISKICFYKSLRPGSNRNMKDLLALSDFTTKESQMVDHSEGIARIKVLQMMREKGIRGQSNGFDKQGRRLHYALNIEHTYREIRKNYTPLVSLANLLIQEPEKEELWNLTKKLFRHKQITTLQESFQLPASH